MKFSFLHHCHQLTNIFYSSLFQIGIQISLSYFSLTKIVEFTPLHLLNNHLEVSMRTSRHTSIIIY